jgi:spore coat protein CotF
MTNQPALQSAEIGKLWATYIGNTMSKCILKYYLKCVKDNDIKSVLNKALNLSESFVQTIKNLFIQENFPNPIGFTDSDVNLNAPRLFSDEFYLHYLKYVGKTGMGLYEVGIPLLTREDIRNFFTNALQSTVNLINEVNLLAMEKGFITNPPPIPIPQKVDFVKKQSYLKGFFGDIRPLHSLEIAHLYDNIENDVTSKALVIGFGQVAKNKEIKQFLERGKEINQKHIELFSQKLDEDNLPSPSLIDHLVTPSTVAPFSDKLMLFHKIDMFSMKLRSYANGASVNGRRDIGLMYYSIMKDVGLYVEDGANLTIDCGWMEQPPQATDRGKLVSK